MGQLYSKFNEENEVKSIESCNSSIRVEHFKATIDAKPTEIDEKSTSVIKYRTPYFR